MQYMMMFYENEAEFAKRDNPAEAGAYWGAWGAYIEALNQAGIIVRGDGLLPPRGGDHGPPRQWRKTRPGRPGRCHQGTARRLFRHRRPRSRHGAGLGRAQPQCLGRGN